MRDFRDAKTMAHALRNALQVKAVETTHSECLELIAKAFGFENWNILAAKIETAQSRRSGASVRRRSQHERHVPDRHSRPGSPRFGPLWLYRGRGLVVLPCKHD